MSPPKTIFIILSLIFIFMAIKGHTNVLAHQAEERKKQAQKQAYAKHRSNIANNRFGNRKKNFSKKNKKS